MIPTLYAGAKLPPRDERNRALPYVIKTSRGSGGNIFVREAPDWDEIERKLEAFLAHKHGQITGELFYLRIPPGASITSALSPSRDIPENGPWWDASTAQFLSLRECQW